MKSRRLPGKAMLPLWGVPVVALIVRRLKTSLRAGGFVFATTDLPDDDILANTVGSEEIAVYRGSENDVLGRNLGAATAALPDATHLVRATGDCPFIDGATLDQVLESCGAIGPFDLATTKPAYPHGIDYEVVPLALLREIDRQALSDEEREHLCNYIYRHEEDGSRYRIVRLEPAVPLRESGVEFLLDTPADYEKLLRIAESSSDLHISVEELIASARKLR
jgi:spore coat polysaccharide biosynthesis protein SpsF